MDQTTRNLVVFVWCYEEHFKRAQEAMRPYPWAVVISIPFTRYLQYAIYERIYNSKEVEGATYVGTYKFDPEQDVGALHAFLTRLAGGGSGSGSGGGGADEQKVFALGGLIENMLEQAQSHHPHFQTVWNEVLRRVTGTPVTASAAIKLVVQCNMVTTVTVFRRIVAFLQRVKVILDVEGADGIPHLWDDSRHSEAGVGADVCQKHFGRPYYPYHAFICERIPSYMIWKEELELVDVGAEIRPTFKIYVLGYNDVTMQQARQNFANTMGEYYEPIHIHTTKYLENIMYKHVLTDRERDWECMSYVGTLAYSAPSKITLPDLHARSIAIQQTNPDVIVLFSSRDRLVDQAQRHHPLFTELWCKILGRLGYSRGDALNPGVPTYFSNFWLAKPRWMREYMDFYKRAEQVMDSVGELQDMLYANSRYGGKMTKERCMEVFGRPYYPYHPFICERLPCFFFWKHGAKLMDLTETPKRHKTFSTGRQHPRRAAG